ncbi:MAG: recombinase family protein [Bradyrhizobium sp.]
MRYEFARVSSKSQDYQGQLDALKAAGCDKIYSEKISGKTTDDRRQFKRLMKDLLPGDIVVVVKLDRLARSGRDLHNILHELDANECGFVSLGEGWCDTTTSVGRLIIAIMAGSAKFERELIRQRCDEGLERARANGVKFGRRPKLSQFQIDEAKRRLAAGESQSEVGRLFGVSHQTIGRI